MDNDPLSHQFSVYIVDDEQPARDLVEACLLGTELKLSLFSSAEEFSENCKHCMPDLAIVDRLLPGLSGDELCLRLKQQTASSFLPILMLTSQKEIVDKVSGLNCGADDYLTKPFAFDELIARVRSLLRIKQLTNQLQKTQDLLADREKQLIAMEVAGAAAHELGQPLTSVLLNCELLQKEGNNRDILYSISGKIVEQCARMRAIIAQLTAVRSYATRDYAGGLKILELPTTKEPVKEAVQP